MFLFGSLQLCYSFLLHFSDSFIYSTTQLPHLVCFLIPIHILDTLHFTPIGGLMLHSNPTPTFSHTFPSTYIPFYETPNI